jgi:hypothetical protein
VRRPLESSRWRACQAPWKLVLVLSENGLVWKSDIQ